MQNENMNPQNIPEYDFDIIEIIKAGFQRIEGVKGIFLASFVGLYGCCGYFTDHIGYFLSFSTSTS